VVSTVGVVTTDGPGGRFGLTMCKIAGQHCFGSHVLLIGEVVAALMNESRALSYHDRKYCQLEVRQ
jgi:flavin reductase (DIM6/NTAB) family NADH-FMN oxidoreductase RutF